MIHGLVLSPGAVPSGGGIPGVGLVDIAGSELVTNGEFLTDLTGWTDASSAGGTVAWNAGRMATTNTSGTPRARSTTVSVSGKRYRVIARNYGVQGVCNLGTAVGGAQYFTDTTTNSVPGLVNREFAASATTAHIQFGTFNAATTSLWDHVSIRSLTETAFPAGTVFTDDFARADGLAGVMPGGLPWRYITPLANTNVFSQISSGVLIAPDSGQASTACYNVLTLGRFVKSVHCDISFVGTSGNVGSVAMIAMAPADPKSPTVAEIVQNSIHVVFTQTNVIIGIFDNGVYDQPTVTYAAPCATDGTIYQDVGWSLAGNTMTLTLPDGTTSTYSDSRFSAKNGLTAIVEHYWFAGNGPSRIHAVAVGMS